MRICPATMSLAIVIEGGGLRGAFAVGVLAELAAILERPATHVYATSSGAPNAAYFATGQIASGVEIWERRTHGAQLVDYKNLVGPRPVMKIDELVAVFRDEIRLDAARLATSPSALHIAVTNVESGAGELVQATPDNLFELLHAAMAIPIAYGRVVPVAGGRYIDGGFRAPLAIREALAREPSKVVAVLTKPRGHRRKRSVVGGWLQGRSYPEFPHLREAIADKWSHYNATMDLVDTLEDSGRILALRPPGDLPVTRLSRSRERIHATIELGRETVRGQLAQLRAYLA
jgi:predicted patatin/cPLA2 family phospholipase